MKLLRADSVRKMETLLDKLTRGNASLVKLKT